jgi:hypothetical protein
MKAEVTATVLLLAIAAALWSWNPTAVGEPENTTLTDSDSPSQFVSNSHYRATTGESGAKQFLDEAILQLRNSSPLIAQVKLQIDLLDREFLGTGQYSQTGEGSPKSRWDLTVEGVSPSLHLSQIFDGRFFYRLETQGDQRTLSCVDLYEVRNLSQKKVPGVANISSWFGTGSLAVMLEQFQSTFDFQVVPSSQSAESNSDQTMQMTILRGEWNREAIRQLLRDQVNPDAFESKIHWNRLPGQLPHSVDLYLGTDGYLTSFPYQMVFYQFVPTAGEEFARKQIFKLQLHRVEKRDSFAAEQFEVSASDLQPVDLTNDHIARIKMYVETPLK